MGEPCYVVSKSSDFHSFQMWSSRKNTLLLTVIDIFQWEFVSGLIKAQIFMSEKCALWDVKKKKLSFLTALGTEFEIIFQI